MSSVELQPTDAVSAQRTYASQAPAIPPRTSRPPSFDGQQAQAQDAQLDGDDGLSKGGRGGAGASSSSYADPYDEDRARSPCRYFWYRWINPWVRMTLIVITLYLYAMSSGVLTYRNNDFQDQMQRLVNTAPNPNPNDVTSTVPGDPPSTRPEREDDVNYYPYLPSTQYYVPFILRDLFFDFIPALQGDTRTPWKNFADATPIIWNVVMLLMLLIRMDVIRWSEYIAIQWILFSVNALVHVATTYPDAGGYQSSCIDADKHVAGGWMWHYITTSYCGDMMWSGHTQETLLPMIMIRRLMWDFLGWNLTWAATEPVPRHEALERHPWIFSGYHNDHERNQLFQRYVQQHHELQAQGQAPAKQMHERKEDAEAGSAPPLATYAPAYASTQSYGGPRTASAVADEIALQPHERYDVNINVAAATELRPNQRPNVDHDIFFRIYKSPYKTPDIVERHRALCFALATFVRVALVIWFPFLLVALLLCRYHYSADLLVAIFVTSLVCTNTHLLQWWVRCLCYRPYYHNVLYASPFRPMYLKWPLNSEQVNYEERIRRVGIGGML